MARAPLAVLALLASLPAAQEPLETQRYDVRALLAADAYVPAGVDTRPVLSSTVFLDALEPDAYDVPLEDPYAPWAWGWQGLLDRMTGATAADPIEVTTRGGALVVQASPAAQARVARALAALEDHVAREVTFELWRLDGASLPADLGAVLTAAEADALLAAATPLEAARGAGRLTRPVRLGAMHRVAAVVDHDVEVAQYAHAADPLVGTPMEGTELGAVARALPDGALHVRAWGRRAELETPFRVTELESLLGAGIALPAARGLLVQGAARVEDGGGLLLGEASSELGVLLVRARRAARPLAPRPFVPVGDLTAMPLLTRPPFLLGPSPSGGWAPWSVHPADRDEAMGAAPFAWLELLEGLRTELDARGLAGAVELVEDELYVEGPGATRAFVAGHMAEWRALLDGTCEVELRHGRLDADAAAGVARGELDAAALADLLPGRLLGACRLEGDLQLWDGGERTYLMDHDVEIAQAAQLADPIVENLLSGVSLWLRPSRGPSGALSAWIGLEVQQETRELARQRVAFAMETPPVDPEGRTATGSVRGAIELPRAAHHEVQTRLQVEDGAWRLATLASLPGTGGSFAAVLRVSVEDGGAR